MLSLVVVMTVPVSGIVVMTVPVSGIHITCATNRQGEYVEIKRPTICNRLVSLLQNLLFAQHVSGNHLYNSRAPDDGHNGARNMLGKQ